MKPQSITYLHLFCHRFLISPRNMKKLWYHEMILCRLPSQGFRIYKGTSSSPDNCSPYPTSHTRQKSGSNVLNCCELTLWNAYCIPGPLLITLHECSYVATGSSYYCLTSVHEHYPQFIHEDTETEWGWMIVCGPKHNKYQNQFQTQFFVIYQSTNSSKCCIPTLFSLLPHLSMLALQSCCCTSNFPWLCMQWSPRLFLCYHCFYSLTVPSHLPYYIIFLKYKHNQFISFLWSLYELLLLTE